MGERQQKERERERRRSSGDRKMDPKKEEKTGRREFRPAETKGYG